MKYFLTTFLGLIITCVLAVTALAQDSRLQEYLTRYEQAQASGDIVETAKYALVLTESDFSGAPLSPLDVRDLKTNLTDPMVTAGMQREAISVLGQLITEDQRYLAVETDSVTRSDIHTAMANRLVKLGDIYEEVGANSRALYTYREAHLVLKDMAKVQNTGPSDTRLSRGPTDAKVRTLSTAIDDVINQYSGRYKGRGDQGTLSVTAKIVALLGGQVEAYQQAGNTDAAIETLSLIRFYVTFQCGEGASACASWVSGTTPPSLRRVNTELASEWMSFAMPEQSFRDLVCNTGDISDIFSLGLNKRYAKLLGQSWDLTGNAEDEAVQDHEALREAKKMLRDVPESDPVHACLIKLQALVNRAAESKNIRFVPETYMSMVTQSIQSKPNFETLTVFYGTNRNLDNVDKPDKTFGKKRGTPSYGWIDVTVPKDRAVGAVPRPGFLDFGGAKDGVHIVLSRVDRTDDISEFSTKFAESVAQSDRPVKEAFVYIHGHGNSFAQSARRTAQLAVDLDIRNGGAFFSWPAGSVATGYTASEGNVDISVAPLKSFLTTIATESGADKVHVIAHSMGNRILLKALKDMDDAPLPYFDQIIWASPDIDAQFFGQSVGAVADKAEGMTLYASQHDRALKLSRWLHGKYPRAGQAPPLPEVTNAGDVIAAVDTSEVARRSKDFIAHADYAGGAITDLRSIVWLSLAPEARKCTIIKTDTVPYWKAGSRSDCPETEYGLALSEVRLNGLSGARQAVQAKINDFRTAGDAGNVQTWQSVSQILSSPQFVWQ